MVDEKIRMKTCPVCKGTGVNPEGFIVHGSCPRCDGAGKIPADED